MADDTTHIPVLLTEAIEQLNIKSNGIYIDGTFGRGGHSQAILDKLDEQGRLIGIDKDPAAIAFAKERFEKDKRFTIEHGSFADIKSIAMHHNILGKVDGILLDLGVSSPQLDEGKRGFSFSHEGPLDMRMDTTQGMDAATWVNEADEEEIALVLKEYGEERFAKRIAGFIVKERSEEPITTTKRLADIVTRANPKWEKHKNPATRAFQGIRIFINRELEDLKQGLNDSIDVLAIGGRLTVISFHSLEDRIVKQFIKKESEPPKLPKGIPVKETEQDVKLRKVGKKTLPTQEEINKNPRARSSVLRSAERVL